MKYLRKFDSVQGLNEAVQGAQISFMGLAYDNGTPVMENKVVTPTPANDEIWYTSSDGNVIEIYESGFEPLEVVSNTYNGGKGVIKLSGELTTFDYGFAEINTLTSVTIPDSVTTIGDEAFRSCSSLVSITIPESVTSIGDAAFNSCSSLVSITIPESVTSIGGEVFSGCTNLSSIVVDSNNTKYDSRDNSNAIIETATNTLVYGCKNTVIPNTVTTIGVAAFHYQTSLTDITIPNSVTTIETAAFNNCRGLVTLTVPNTVTTIQSEAFYDIPNVIYNGSAMGSPWGAKTINGCVDGDFVYTDNTKTNLVDYIGSSTSIKIPDSVIILNNWTFKYIKNDIISIDFGNSLQEIPEYIFPESNLTSITINNGIIGEYAFTDCTGLTSLIFGNGNISIGEGAFDCCTGLTSITIPNNVTSISSWAFYGCTGLSSITCLGSTPLTLTECEFDETNDCPIYVPAASVDAYKSAWSSYASRIQAIQS